MPVYGDGEWLGPDARTDGGGVVAAGRFSWGPGPVRFDRHHHDHDELWMVSDGRAVVLIDGEEREVGPGDILLHRAGDDHDLIAVRGLVRGFFVETGHPVGGRAGHRHRTPQDAEGHAVAVLPAAGDDEEVE